jgi:hypothetical protein
MINTNSTTIRLPGWGNIEKSTYEEGRHHIEVWVDSCMVYRKSFIVDLSHEERVEEEKRKTEQQARTEGKNRKEQTKQNMCHYCKRELADENYAHKITIYKEINRSINFSGRKVEFRTAEIFIPRCKKCNDIHIDGSIWFMAAPVSIFSTLGLFLGLTLWGYWLGFLLLGCVIGLIIGYILVSINDYRRASKANIKTRGNIKDYEPLKKMLINGWSLNEPSA